MTAARAEKAKKAELSAAERMEALRQRQERKKQGLIAPPPSAPLAVARHLLKKWTDPQGRILLRKWRGDFYRFVGPEWVIYDPESLRSWIYEQLEHVTFEKTDKKSGESEEILWCPDKGKVDKVLDAMAVPSLIPVELDAPAWLTTGESAAGLVPCRNALVDVDTQAMTAPTPDYFGTVAIPFEYNPQVMPPMEWLKFLRTLWPTRQVDCDPATCTMYPGTCQGQHEAEEILSLQQWFGYVLSGRLDLQKMLLLVGPPRSGKGTIARTLQELAGWANCSAPTLAGIAQNFGLETSIGKTLMVVGDARLSQQGQETVVERLLSISGQDTITLDRKNRTAWTGTMQTRIMVLSNELPRFVDASGAIASRFVVLKLGTSFLGCEDMELGGRVRAELPGILKWALDGLTSLNKAKRLFEPGSHILAMQELIDLVSPISAFIRDVCDFEPGPQLSGLPMVPFQDLYIQYQSWCTENGRGAKNTAGFSADLKTQLPWIQTDYRPRVEGTRTPRHVVGLRIHPEWTNRARRSSAWGR